MITDDTHIFDVMHLSDSFFPTGLFATSNGLESMFLNRVITTPDQLYHFIETIINQQVGPSECIILSNAYDVARTREYDEIANIDKICYAVRPIKESREVSIRSGTQLAKCVKEFESNELLDWYLESINESKITGIYPVSFAVCCSILNISKKNTLSMFLHGFVVSVVGAALRLGMIQHYQGQKIIHCLKPLLADIVNDSMTKSVSDVWQFAPHIEIFQMKHEKTDSKMFIT